MYLTVDFITKLLLVAGKNMILVVCDRLLKMTYFVVMTEGTMAEELAWLFMDNMWKLYGFLESVVLDEEPQFTVELTKKLNKMLGVETKLFLLFYSQTDGQTERINQELEQYLWFFIDYRQKDWPEWLAIAKFAVKNKTHSVTKVSLFMACYNRVLRMRADIRRKGKIDKATKFAKRIKKVQKGAEAALRKIQEEMKQQADKRRKEIEEWKKRNKVMLSIKNLVFKECLVKKLVDFYVGPYIIYKVVSTNAVKL